MAKSSKKQIITVHNKNLKAESRALNTALPYMEGWEEGALPKELKPKNSGDQSAEVPAASAPADTSDAARRAK